MHTILENRFADRRLYKALSAKIIIDEEPLAEEGEFVGNTVYEMPDTLQRYLEFLHSTHEVHAVTLGYHENGKNLIPHIHVHSIVAESPLCHKDRSKLRSKYARQNEVEFREKISERCVELSDNNLVFNFLAYPMKEGKMFDQCAYLLDKKMMDQELLMSLLCIARSIYNGACADQANREKSDERRRVNFEQMWEVAKGLGERENLTLPFFNAYMHEAYFKSLSRDNLPTPRNGNDNLWKCAFLLGLVRYEVK